jgi:hypothetical protein
MRAVRLASPFLRAPPKRASGDVCFLLTSTYIEVGKPEVKWFWGSKSAFALQHG